MAKATRRRLKVFQTQLGFYDSVVAASSKAGALRAWGVRRDLFAQGLADVATDQAAVEVALAYPDIALKRPTGSTVPYSVAPGRPKAADIDRDGNDASESNSDSAPVALPTTKPPDRSRLDAARAGLKALDVEHDIEAVRLRAVLEEIAAEEAALQ